MSRGVFAAAAVVRWRCLSLALAIASGSVMAACADQHAEDVVRSQSSLVGMPKPALLSCAGVPARTATADGTEFLTYVSSTYGGVGAGPTIGLGLGGFSGGYGGGGGGGIGLGFPLSSGVSGSACTATFTLQNDVVTQLSYNGGADTSQCYAIVQNCLSTGGGPAGGSGY